MKLNKIQETGLFLMTISSSLLFLLPGLGFLLSFGGGDNYEEAPNYLFWMLFGLVGSIVSMYITFKCSKTTLS